MEVAAAVDWYKDLYYSDCCDQRGQFRQKDKKEEAEEGLVALMPCRFQMIRTHHGYRLAH
jgi:hypothetical protein